MEGSQLLIGKLGVPSLSSFSSSFCPFPLFREGSFRQNSPLNTKSLQSYAHKCPPYTPATICTSLSWSVFEPQEIWLLLNCMSSGRKPVCISQFFFCLFWTSGSSQGLSHTMWNSAPKWNTGKNLAVLFRKNRTFYRMGSFLPISKA